MDKYERAALDILCDASEVELRELFGDEAFEGLAAKGKRIAQ